MGGVYPLPVPDPDYDFFEGKDKEIASHRRP